MKLNSAYCIGELVQCSIVGQDMLNAKVQIYMNNNAVAIHSTGLVIRVCNLDYPGIGITSDMKRWIECNYPPICGTLTIFGATFFSDEHVQPIIFFMGSKWDIYAYVSGVMFYIAPNMQQFWTSAIFFEYCNAIFSSDIAMNINRCAWCLDDLVRTYDIFDIRYTSMQSRRSADGCIVDNTREMITFILLEMERAISENRAPFVFVDESILKCNCDHLFFVKNMAPWIRIRNTYNTIAEIGCITTQSGDLSEVDVQNLDGVHSKAVAARFGTSYDTDTWSSESFARRCEVGIKSYTSGESSNINSSCWHGSDKCALSEHWCNQMSNVISRNRVMPYIHRRLFLNVGFSAAPENDKGDALNSAAKSDFARLVNRRSHIGNATCNPMYLSDAMYGNDFRVDNYCIKPNY